MFDREIFSALWRTSAIHLDLPKRISSGGSCALDPTVVLFPRVFPIMDIPSAPPSMHMPDQAEERLHHHVGTPEMEKNAVSHFLLGTYNRVEGSRSGVCLRLPFPWLIVM